MAHKMVDEGFFDFIKKKWPDFDFDLISSFVKAVIAMHEGQGLLDTYFTKVGLSKGRFQVLIQLYRLEEGKGMSLSDICIFYKVSSATMTGLVDTLEKDDMIERYSCCEDRRRVNIRLTEKGMSFMDEFLPVHARNILMLTSTMSEEEKSQLMTLLIKFTDSLKENMDKVSGVNHV